MALPLVDGGQLPLQVEDSVNAYFGWPYMSDSCCPTWSRIYLCKVSSDEIHDNAISGPLVVRRQQAARHARCVSTMQGHLAPCPCHDAYARSSFASAELILKIASANATNQKMLVHGGPVISQRNIHSGMLQAGRAS